MRAPVSKKTINWARVFRTFKALSRIICFPIGLYDMWTKRHWPRVLKTAVSVFVVLLIIAILGPMTDPPERQTGGILLVGEDPEVVRYGPEAPENRLGIVIYAPRKTDSIILDPTPTPEPIIVYCNNGGRYYHVESCKYVKEDTPDAFLQDAVKAGFTRCVECNAPTAY